MSDSLQPHVPLLPLFLPNPHFFLTVLLNPDSSAIFSFLITFIYPLHDHPLSFSYHLFPPTLGSGSATGFVFGTSQFNYSLRRTVPPSLLSHKTNFLSIYLSIYLSLCLSVCLSIRPLACPPIYLSKALESFVWPWSLFSFLNLYIVGRTPWTGDQPVTRPLPLHRTT
jgi:hypothetical protein